MFARPASAKSPSLKLTPENENASPGAERHFLFLPHFFMNGMPYRPSATHEYSSHK
jgi:hypothetical protein